MTQRRHVVWGRLVLTGLALIALMAGTRLFAAAAAPSGDYMKPRYPRYLINPSKDRLLRAARFAVRQTGGRTPLGREKSGDTVYVFVDQQDMDVWEAIKTAWAERGIKGIAVPGWEYMAMPQAAWERRARENLLYGKDGWKEIGVFEPLFAKYLPPDIQKQFGDPLTHFAQIYSIDPYLDKHPEIKAYYWAPGGGGPANYLGGASRKNASRHHGNWTYKSKTDLLAKSTEFPADVWALVEEQVIKPKRFSSEGTFNDPEGTRLHWTVTPEQAAAFAENRFTIQSADARYQTPKVEGGAGNHLFIYPTVLGATWKEGVIKGSANHIGFMPAMTVHLSDEGRVIKVEGGGKDGDLFRMLLAHPAFKNAHFPGARDTGFWYLNQDGLALNPKYIRDYGVLENGGVNYTNLTERERAGVQHFSFASPAGPASDEPKFVEWAKKAGVILKHTAHIHNYFGTVKFRLADTGEWITIVDKGRVTPLDNAEVRALAARYGDPDLILRYEWVPEIPGINAPGDYARDYAADSWKWVMNEWARIQKGTFEYVDDYQMGGAQH